MVALQERKEKEKENLGIFQPIGLIAAVASAFVISNDQRGKELR